MRTLFCAGLAFIAACAGSAPAPRSSGKEAAKPAEAGEPPGAFALEIEAQPAQQVVAPDGSFKGTLEATQPPTVKPRVDGFAQVDALLGETKLICLVHLGEKDLGDMMRELGANAFEKGIEHKWVDVHGDQVQSFR